MKNCCIISYNFIIQHASFYLTYVLVTGYNCNSIQNYTVDYYGPYILNEKFTINVRFINDNLWSALK
jgi:hypothetical protein